MAANWYYQAGNPTLVDWMRKPKMRNLVFMVLVLLMAAAFVVAGASAPATQANSDADTETDGVAPSGLTAAYTEGRLTLSWTKGTDATYTEQIVE